MNIQAKLSLTYISLLSIGVIIISAYAILSIRAYLLDDAITQFEKDAQVLADSFQNSNGDVDLYKRTAFAANLTGYEIALFDSSGSLLVNVPDNAPDFIDSRAFINAQLQIELKKKRQVIINIEDLEDVFSFHRVEKNVTEVRYLRITQNKKELYAVSASIRHLIYGAMIGSILVVILVSIYFARYLSKPIQQLKEAALDVANGNLDRELDISRNDEFGSLAKSLNQMAKKLKDDYEKQKTLNKKQNQFFADIAHEVRNPLHTISGALDMIQLKELDEKKKTQYLNTAQRQIERVVRLFQDIKSLQRYDMDTTFIHKTEFILEDMIDEVVNTYMPIANQKKLLLSFDYSQKNMVFGDKEKLEQVIDNLISNAIKYTSNGKIQVSTLKNNHRVIIEVEDSGIGIDEKHLNRLFDRFYRTDKARSRDKGGTGLGLAVVKGILSAHKTEIYVDSTPGKGSRFYFNLSII